MFCEHTHSLVPRCCRKHSAIWRPATIPYDASVTDFSGNTVITVRICTDFSIFLIWNNWGFITYLLIAQTSRTYGHERRTICNGHLGWMLFAWRLTHGPVEAVRKAAMYVHHIVWWRRVLVMRPCTQLPRLYMNAKSTLYTTTDTLGQ